ncbi:similar to phosphoserine aminotransferase [Plenodomus lingam JN3]|uniref:phosphoserine transaminase n=1 Tax=Leptosphaeria maculans (strain JN3 / isolate v23.1.3 / race Av1-4-5-6-7-8) TaxID=985895 RepID=E5A046_LEPMJ|nr:similar to phosphoserine aminotransferase [Plenodomus lingam JN3]CBX96906.1 similar to phosphoserine aminotransferase [Plenodomus lingam JN3]
MVNRSDVNYFGAGPAPLPTEVLERASQVLLNYKDKGIGICEISHRSPEANEVLAEAKQALTTLLDIPDDYDILFLQSGGSGEFSATVYNLVSIWVEKKRAKIAEEVGDDKDEVLKRLRKVVDEELKLDYLVTGSWSLKASQEAARLVGAKHVNVAVDARKANEGKFGKIPSEDQWNLTPRSKGGPAFVYYCDNETVDGVEFPSFPESLKGDDAPLVCADMSSNFISRTINVRDYAVIFGGAQKNIGNTGIAIVILRKSLLPPHSTPASPDLLRQLNLAVGPIVLDYPTIAKNNSLYNTLPIFDVWVAGQVMSGLVNTYGTKRIGGQEEISNEKTRLIYGALEKYPEVYRVVPDKSVASRMNICFRVNGGDADKEKAFLTGAEKRGLLGLKGHRSVGGIRASNYNAVSLNGAKLLVSYLEDFAKST